MAKIQTRFIVVFAEGATRQREGKTIEKITIKNKQKYIEIFLTTKNLVIKFGLLIDLCFRIDF